MLSEPAETTALPTLSELLSLVDAGGVSAAQHQFRTNVSAEIMNSIPFLSVSSTNSQTLPAHSLVRFRAMVQDNGFSPQIYISSVSLVNSLTKQKKTVWTHFCDTLPTETFNVESEWQIDDSVARNVKYAQKVPLCCIGLPAETSWAKAAWENHSPNVSDVADSFERMQVQVSGNKMIYSIFIFKLHNNYMLEVDKQYNRHIQRKQTLESTEQLAIVKIYGDDPEDLQLGVMAEFVGFLETSNDVSSEEKEDDFDSLMNSEIDAFKALPTLHCIFYTLISPSAHPLLANSEVKSIDHKALHKLVLDHLQPYVLGDQVAAEYLLIHLVSKIRARHEALQTGYLPLNLTNITSPAISTALVECLKSLLPRVRNIPLSIDYLNKKRMAPGVFVSSEGWKDVVGENTSNHAAAAVIGLVGGELQIPDRTCVVIDEVGMDGGVLKEQGVVNVRHINDLVSLAELPYAIGSGIDVAGHSAGKLFVDLTVLVLSQAKCMFDVQCILRLVPVNVVSTAAANAHATEDLLNLMRAYIASVANNVNYEVPEEMSQVLTKYFMDTRKETAKNGGSLYTQEQFLLRMEIARALTLLDGEQELSIDAWHKSGDLENERNFRAAKGSSSGNVGR
ncbi:hypothetical protein HK100_007368 [Physocladia obscura]|uniref:Uncharacterized protein n=1 Tax=Physocladia obscura TaxID=109957 RepID=A0AAD5T775_9FUNG|nr:hypothetical protein HK100_007368 [Physocladia obscura]